MRLIPLWCALLAALACGGDDDGGGFDAAPAGRACFSGADLDAGTLLASPSADCPSRVCLHVEAEPVDMCTAFCLDASDCTASPETACDGEFVCAAPLDQGPYACRKVCVCDSVLPESGFPVDCP